MCSLFHLLLRTRHASVNSTYIDTHIILCMRHDHVAYIYIVRMRMHIHTQGVNNVRYQGMLSL
jgi:hypothetical protein